MGYSKRQRPVLHHKAGLRDDFIASTSAGALVYGGTVALTSTSTGNGTATNWTLGVPDRLGRRMTIVTASIAATSSPQHVTAPTGYTFDGSTADLLVLSSGGCGVELVALSSSLIGVAGAFGVSFSTST